MAETRNYIVEGMTCGHCEMSVKEEISEIEGVTEVVADHATGAVVVTGENFSDEQVAEAVKEAGYTLV
ncbi:heavy-metal-associated domain-containing protein [Corynebacterium guangdongense]|uniref:Copper chaperone CopZ n=1 Tax=Corynebacterium guangdongense TaxID=1783348 RepID=A0ABU1ZZZ2_9CORY|nr:heavy-metal-associated domain-containing protein [Corynebacterium guangdongense]MDR7330518.1 copper chaperone CopZ [Corynebacterium guangdongense]WJZ19073.1 Mercuric transport protein periplasmic component precursor [Corynebacterium guangdongense]